MRKDGDSGRRVSEDFCLLREKPTGEGAVAVCEGEHEG